jgi:hypothetical protein
MSRPSAYWNTSLQFRNKTQAFEEKIDFLRKQYKDGPVQNIDPKKTTPYASYLNSELQKAITEAKKYADEASGEFDGLTERLIWGALKDIGSPLSGLNSYNEFSRTIEKVKDLNAKVEKAKVEQAELTTLIVKVNILINQFEHIGKKMADALVALGELNKLFENQYETYTALADFLKDTSGSTTIYAMLRARKAFVMLYLNKAIAGFTDVSIHLLSLLFWNF